MKMRPGAVPLEERWIRTLRHLFDGGRVTTRWIAREFGVHPDTARRSMRLLRMLPVHVRRRRNGELSVTLARDADTVRVKAATARNGESNPHSKLTAAKVGAIRARFFGHGMPIARIAEAFGVSSVTVWKIVNRKTWAHLP